MRDFNENHPEMRDDEKFVTNCDHRWANEHYSNISLYRVGSQAYSIDGNHLDHLYVVPIFKRHQKSEKEQLARMFKTGNLITYKSRSSCVRKGGGTRDYYHGSSAGIHTKGFIGRVIECLEYVSEKGCYKIKVTTPSPVMIYTMLESEFEEYESLKEASNIAIVDNFIATVPWGPVKRTFKTGPSVPVSEPTTTTDEVEIVFNF